MANTFTTYNSNTTIPGIPHLLSMVPLGIPAPAQHIIYADLTWIIINVLYIMYYGISALDVLINSFHPLPVRGLHHDVYYYYDNYYMNTLCHPVINQTITHQYIYHVLNYYDGSFYKVDNSFQSFPVRVLTLIAIIISNSITYDALLYISWFILGTMHHESGRTLVIILYLYIYILFIHLLVCTRHCGINIMIYISIVYICGFRLLLATHHQYYIILLDFILVLIYHYVWYTYAAVNSLYPLLPVRDLYQDYHTCVLLVFYILFRYIIHFYFCINDIIDTPH